jgi:protease I
MSSDLEGKRIAILATDGFEQSELLKPKEALESAGAETDVISIKGGRIKGWDMDKWGQEVEVNLNVAEADPARLTLCCFRAV